MCESGGTMKSILFLLPLALLAQDKQPPLPALTACGAAGEAEILCGTRSPEDIEIAPDGKQLLVSQMVRNNPAQGISVYDPLKKSFTKLTAKAEKAEHWGDATC